MKIGFIGLGAMGMPMAENLIKKQYSVTGFDVRPESVSTFEALGGKGAATAAQAAANADVLIVMVVNAAQAESVLFDAGALDAMASAGTVVLMATCAPSAVKSIAARIAATGRHIIDAPVSGGVTAAAAGTLTFLVGGGPDAAVDAVSPFLAAMGAATLRVGPQPGAGQAAKLANNLALAVQMAGLCEALAFGCAALPGLDPARLLAALNASSGRCWSGVAYPPLPGARAEKGGGAVPATDGRYTGGFAARLMLKDLELAAGAAAAAGGAVAGAGVPGGAATPPAASASASATLASLPMATAARALYARLAAEKGEDIDFSGLYPFVYGGLGVGGGGGGR